MRPHSPRCLPSSVVYPSNASLPVVSMNRRAKRSDDIHPSVYDVTPRAPGKASTLNAFHNFLTSVREVEVTSEDVDLEGSPGAGPTKHGAAVVAVPESLMCRRSVGYGRNSGESAPATNFRCMRRGTS